jgi:hypothetical protein
MLHFRFFLRILVAIILFAIFIPFFSFGDPAINIKGHYDVTYYNSSKPSGKMLHVNFSVILGTNNCEILATNQEDPNVWENVLYDGENTYLLTPSDNHLIKSDKSFTTCGLVLPGRQYYFVTISLLDTYILWIAYCLPPQNISPNMPSPVSAWRENINAYGWKWKDVLSTSDGRFLKSFCIVRDVSADLDDQKEFLRPTFQYRRVFESMTSVAV